MALIETLIKENNLVVTENFEFEHLDESKLKALHEVLDYQNSDSKKKSIIFKSYYLAKRAGF